MSTSAAILNHRQRVSVGARARACVCVASSLTTVGVDKASALEAVAFSRPFTFVHTNIYVQYVRWCVPFRGGALYSAPWVSSFRFGQYRMPEGKWNTYDNDLRIPMVVRGPGIKAGAVFEHIASNVDTMPTVLGKILLRCLPVRCTPTTGAQLTWCTWCTCKVQLCTHVLTDVCLLLATAGVRARSTYQASRGLRRLHQWMAGRWHTCWSRT